MNLDLKTERLLIRPFAAADLDIALELFTNPDVCRYAGGVESVEKINCEMSNWVRRGGNGCIGIWTITDRNTGEKHGSIALLPLPVEEDDTDFSLVVPGQVPENDIEIGYFLKPVSWGKGIASEACKRILRFAFEEGQLEEVVATFEEENSASRNVLLKAGFSDHGYRRSYGEDGTDFRITRAEWLATQK
ncbi:MAG: GNAT family N-acetyltransferase [Gammaproteobacteria bacterium]